MFFFKCFRACSFPTQCLKTQQKTYQKPDPHYFLGSLGIRWSAYKKQTCGPEKGLFLKTKKKLEKTIVNVWSFLQCWVIFVFLRHQSILDIFSWHKCIYQHLATISFYFFQQRQSSVCFPEFFPVCMHVENREMVCFHTLFSLNTQRSTS